MLRNSVVVEDPVCLMPLWGTVSPLPSPPRFVVPFQLASDGPCAPTPDTAQRLLGPLTTPPSAPVCSPSAAQTRAVSLFGMAAVHQKKAPRVFRNL